MKTLLLLFALLAPCLCHASDHWTWTDTGLQATYLTLHATDWAQTLHIARNPDTYYETNRFLGQHPSTGRVNSWFATTAVLHTGIAYVLPKPWRTIWQGVTVVVEYDVTRKNRTNGLGVQFHF